MKEEVFRTRVLPLKNMLYRLALRITLSAPEAEDVVQDTLIKVWNRREAWDEIQSMEAFCTAICRNLALDRAKRADNNNAQLDDECRERPDTAPSPEEQAAQTDQLRVVKNIIDSLPEKQRTCMQLRDIEGRTYKEIAAALFISEDQVKVNIFRARQAVKKRFQQLAD